MSLDVYGAKASLQPAETSTRSPGSHSLLLEHFLLHFQLFHQPTRKGNVCYWSRLSSATVDQICRLFSLPAKLPELGPWRCQTQRQSEWICGLCSWMVLMVRKESFMFYKQNRRDQGIPFWLGISPPNCSQTHSSLPFLHCLFFSILSFWAGQRMAHEVSMKDF